jgi:hypothetical protein
MYAAAVPFHDCNEAPEGKERIVPREMYQYVIAV